MQQYSDKINIVDEKTFEKIREGDGRCFSNVRPIRNSKYKKMRKKGGSFNLFDFLTSNANESGPSSERVDAFVHNAKRKRRLKHKRFFESGSVVKVSNIKRGKIREFGKKKKISRLKKSVLLCRQLKSLCRQNQEPKTEICSPNTLEATCGTCETSIEFSECGQEIGELGKRLCQVNINGGSSQNYQGSLKIDEEIGTLQNRLHGLKLADIHSRKFREYCENLTTDELKNLTDQLLRKLDHFQKRAHQENQIKAKAHQRFIVGFRQVQSYLQINKIKLVFIATDCEKCASEGGIDSTITAIKEQCNQLNIPYVFSLTRRQLAYSLYKRGCISCIGILDYSGAQDIYVHLLGALQTARNLYNERKMCQGTLH